MGEPLSVHTEPIKCPGATPRRAADTEVTRAHRVYWRAEIERVRNPDSPVQATFRCMGDIAYQQNKIPTIRPG